MCWASVSALDLKLLRLHLPTVQGFGQVSMSQRVPRQQRASALDPSWDACTAQVAAVTVGGQPAWERHLSRYAVLRQTLRGCLNCKGCFCLRRHAESCTAALHRQQAPIRQGSPPAGPAAGAPVPVTASGSEHVHIPGLHNEQASKPCCRMHSS